MPTRDPSHSRPAQLRSRLGRLGPVAAVATGGFFGSLARVGVGEWLSGVPGEFPAAVLLVNLAGSLGLGLYLAGRERAAASTTSLHFWAVGVLGSFTTFSAFSLDLVHLLEANRYLFAAAYLASSLVGGLLLAVAGRRVGQAIR